MINTPGMSRFFKVEDLEENNRRLNDYMQSQPFYIEYELWNELEKPISFVEWYFRNLNPDISVDYESEVTVSDINSFKNTLKTIII